jgi:hypothetical protein
MAFRTMRIEPIAPRQALLKENPCPCGLALRRSRKEGASWLTPKSEATAQRFQADHPGRY